MWAREKVKRQNGVGVDVSTIKENSKDVVFDLVSCMCDNKSRLRFKKNLQGEFQVSYGREALGNLQMNHDSIDLMWAADEGNWEKVVNMIETGTSMIYGVKSVEEK